MIGKTISHYKILQKLGEGGMGVVYKAEDTRLKRTVALKFLPPELVQSAEWKERFIREAQAAAALDHPCICHTYEIDEVEGQTLIAMAYVEGQTLSEKIASGPLDVAEALDIVRQVAEGLSHAHSQGIVHRDIKPANIMLDSAGRARIMDFGLAKLAGKTRLTRTAAVMGTVAYMSPEQARGDTAIDHRTDIWSLGVLLYEMLTGRFPFDAPTDAALLYKILHEEPEPMAGLLDALPTALTRAIDKTMQKDPRNRYRDMAELVRDLRAVKVRAASGESRSPSIAVLPFVDMSPGRDQEYFCDGMSEALINELTHIEDLKVIARTSAFSFKGKSVNVRDIGRELEVGTILEGSVQKAGNRLRITAQLVDTERGHHLWSERYDRDMDDLFAIQDEITLAIVGKLKPKLLGEQQSRLAKRPAVDREAYSLCLKGRWHRQAHTEEGLRKAFEYYNEAIQKDPNCALAYAGLSTLYVMLPIFAFYPSRDMLPKAKEAALKALEIDDTLSEAHSSLAAVQMIHEWDWEGAEKEHRRAIELNPGNAGALRGYALFLSYLARHDAACEMIDRAVELDPLDPILHANRGSISYYARRYDEATDELKTAIEMSPKRVHGHIWLGIAYMQKSMYEEAMAEFEQERVVSAGQNPLVEAFMGIAYAEMGKQAEARRMLDQVLERAKQGYIPPMSPAGLYFALGEIDKGFEWLDKGYEERDYWLCFLKIEPRVDSVRSDPRFKALLRKIGLDK